MKKNRQEIINFGSKIVFGIITIVLIIIVGYEIHSKEYFEAVIFFVTAMILNPFFIDKIFYKIGSKPDYFYFVTVLYGSMGWFIASTLCLNFGADYQYALKIFMYIIYLIFLFMTKDWGRITKYKIFGVIYFVSIILGYMSENMTDNLIGLLNNIHMIDNLIDINVWALLVEGVLNPVKEAILTYIIFDTIMENEKAEKGEKAMIKENKKENESVENHIIIEDKKIVLENITLDIELETDDLHISIRKK